MLLTADIGNTNITIGIYDGEELRYRARLHTNRKKTADEYAVDLYAMSRLNRFVADDINGAIVSSVVPEITGAFVQAINLFCNVESMVLGPGIKSGLNIRIDNPAQLGADLVAGAVAAVNHYELPCVVIDLGTATKISVLDEQGTYCGCSIAPGVRISLETLSASASQLPAINLDVPTCPAYGKNTVASMQAGIILGTACMLDGMCDRIEESLGQKIMSVVITGGHARGIIKHCKRDHTFCPDLLLEGLRIIYNKNI